MPFVGVLGSYFEKSLSYLKSAPSNMPYCKVRCKKKKKKILKFGTTKAILSYLESAPSDLPNCEIS